MATINWSEFVTSNLWLFKMQKKSCRLCKKHHHWLRLVCVNSV